MTTPTPPETDQPRSAESTSQTPLDSEPGPRTNCSTRRTFTTEFKRAIVQEDDVAPNGSKAEIPRRERLYDSHIQEWRVAFNAGALQKKPAAPRGRPKSTAEQAQINQLLKDLATERAVRQETGGDWRPWTPPWTFGEKEPRSWKLPAGKRIITAAGHQSCQAAIVPDLTEHLGVVSACTLVGRSRATPHRQANPKPGCTGPGPRRSTRRSSRPPSAPRSWPCSTARNTRTFHRLRSLPGSGMKDATGARCESGIGFWPRRRGAGNGAGRPPTRRGT